jgi:hypothetical protein
MIQTLQEASSSPPLLLENHTNQHRTNPNPATIQQLKLRSMNQKKFGKKEERKREKKQEEVEEKRRDKGAQGTVLSPEGRAARQGTVLSPQDRSARLPQAEKVLSPLVRTARSGMVLSPLDRAARPNNNTSAQVLSPFVARSAQSSRSHRLANTPLPARDGHNVMWKGEWQERYGPIDGIAPASSLYEFRCLLCRKDYNIGKMGIEAVKRHITQCNHAKMRISALDHLKEKILALLEESTEGLGNEDLIQLTAPSEDLPLSNGHREWAINELDAEGKVVATRTVL